MGREEINRRAGKVRDIFRRKPEDVVGVLWHWGAPQLLVVIVCVPKDKPFCFRFDDMPKIAAALETEHLDFQAERGSYVVDSFTFDGTNCLTIVARY
jgi:hypothetical protein